MKNCPICGGIDSLAEFESESEITINEKEINYISLYYKCIVCEREFTTTAMDEENMMRWQFATKITK
jgi:hypothetical protein